MAKQSHSNKSGPTLSQGNSPNAAVVEPASDLKVLLKGLATGKAEPAVIDRIINVVESDSTGFLALIPADAPTELLDDAQLDRMQKALQALPARKEALHKLCDLLGEYKARERGEPNLSLQDLISIEKELSSTEYLASKVPPNIPEVLAELWALRELCGLTGSPLKPPGLERATTMYRKIVVALFGEENWNDDISSRLDSLEEPLAQQHRELLNSKLPLVTTTSTSQSRVERQFSLNDVSHIARVTGVLYPPDLVLEAAQFSGQSGIAVENWIERVRKTEQSADTTFIKKQLKLFELSDHAMKLLAPVVAREDPGFQRAQFADKLLAIAQWPDGREILTTLIAISDGIAERKWVQQDKLPKGFGKMIGEVYSDLFPDTRGLSNQSRLPARPAAVSTAIETEVMNKLKGRLGEVQTQLNLLDNGWRILEVSKRDVNGHKLISSTGEGSQQSYQTRREVDIVAISPDNTEFTLIEVKASALGVLRSSYGVTAQSGKWQEAIQNKIPGELDPQGQTAAYFQFAASEIISNEFNNTLPQRVMHVIASEDGKLAPTLLQTARPLFDEIGTGTGIPYSLKIVDKQGLTDYPNLG